MAKERNKSSTIFSLAMHIGIAIALFYFSKPISVLIPSRSDGIEVSLVSMPNQTVMPYTPKVKITAPAPIKTMDTPADINVKQNNQTKPQPTPAATTPPKVEAKPIEKPVTKDNNQTQSPTTAKPKTAKNQKAMINDLLGDVMSTNTTSVRKGKAVGGNPNGTSDSDNLIGNYADQVINAVRPFVVIPDDVNPNAKAVVKVILNPDMSVRQVSLIKSSGNDAYDQNIQTAINRVRVFPPLPDNAQFVDYRVLRLTFKPQ